VLSGLTEHLLDCSFTRLKVKAQLYVAAMFCKIPLSVKHFLLHCPGFNANRRLFYEVTSLKDIFNEIMPEKVLDFFIIC